MRRTETPLFSIVVPTLNRPDQLATLLRSVARCRYPRDHFEVILVDDGSDEPIDTVIAPFRAELDVTVLRQPNAGPANARQSGADVARGRYLAFTDDDCVLAPDWLEVLERACAAASGCAIGGRTVNALPENPYSSASQLLTGYLYAHYNRDPADARSFATNNLVFPAHLFRKIGGLDRAWSIQGGEDRDLCRRWVEQGHRMVYRPDLVVLHAHHLGFKSFLRQHVNYGRGAFRFRSRAPRGPSRRIRLEPLRFYLGMPVYAFRKLPLRRALSVTLLLVLSQVANAMGFVSQAIGDFRHGSRSRRD